MNVSKNLRVFDVVVSYLSLGPEPRPKLNSQDGIRLSPTHPRCTYRPSDLLICHRFLCLKGSLM